MLPDRLFLTFHGLGAPPAGTDPVEAPYWVAPAVLEGVARRAKADPRLAITFDDGLASDFHLARPVLEEAGVRATFFVLAGRLDAPGSLSRAQLAEMAQAGMAIGNHGWDHRDWTRATDAEMRRELHDARRAIEDVAGVAVDTLSIPFGAFDARVLNLIFEAGYTAAHTSSGGLAAPGARLVPRNTVKQGFDADRDIARLTGWRGRVESGLRDPLRRWKYGVRAA
ncbi:polysaccharide deacetylase family protein [Ancylobacter terrae]|uniref:polysaccharide deacetylase family protein n=1 Tax=Ancylobacter sp. sgz301288 TaxID=3342077 RepID=UPI0038589809